MLITFGFQYYFSMFEPSTIIVVINKFMGLFCQIEVFPVAVAKCLDELKRLSPKYSMISSFYFCPDFY